MRRIVGFDHNYRARHGFCHPKFWLMWNDALVDVATYNPSSSYLGFVQCSHASTSDKSSYFHYAD